MSLNTCMIIGNLGRDPEMRYTSSGQAVTQFTVACNRNYKDAQGERQEETEWFRVVAWDKLGEICNQYLTQGTRVYVEGRLQTRKWQDKDGADRYSTEVIANDMIILSSRQDRPAASGDYEAPAEEDAQPPQPQRSAAAPSPARPANGNSAPRPAATRAPARNVPQTIESDEDLPF